jgi:hypothetical protein
VIANPTSRLDRQEPRQSRERKLAFPGGRRGSPSLPVGRGSNQGAGTVSALIQH